MSIQLPYVDMPKELVSVLKMNNLGPHDKMNRMRQLVMAEPHLKILVEDYFARKERQETISEIMGIADWEAWRDRMSSIYIHRKKTGKYTRDAKLSLVDDILGLEAKCRRFFVESSARAFLFGFYLTLANIERQQMSEPLIALPMDIFRCLEIVSQKSPDIDWIMIFIWHYVAFKGADQFIVRFKEQIEDDFYQTLYLEFNEMEKELYISNLLAYSYSIQEVDFLVNKGV